MNIYAFDGDGTGILLIKEINIDDKYVKYRHLLARMLINIMIEAADDIYNIFNQSQSQSQTK